MKKTRKSKIYEQIGRAITYIAGWAIFYGTLVYVVCNCCTTIR